LVYQILLAVNVAPAMSTASMPPEVDANTRFQARRDHWKRYVMERTVEKVLGVFYMDTELCIWVHDSNEDDAEMVPEQLCIVGSRIETDAGTVKADLASVHKITIERQRPTRPVGEEAADTTVCLVLDAGSQ